jgi:Mg2+-importing ATPase
LHAAGAGHGRCCIHIVPTPIATLDALFAELRGERDGLSVAEAARRLRALGPNATATVPLRRHILDAVRAIANPLVVILLAAGAVSAFLGEPIQAAIIATIVVLSGAVNLWQTSRSARAVKRLQAQITPMAKVRRGGAWIDVPRRDVVEGDLVQLGAGDLVPADVRLVEASDLHVQQAALTGESFPAEKAASSGALPAGGPDRPELVYLGSSIVSGTATALVFATGERTQFGDIVERLGARPEETEFEHGMHRYGVLILRTVVFLVLFVLVVNIGYGRAALDSLMFSVALAVGLTPEFLPMITTVTLAQGAIRMAREKVIVKHLPAIQNLGSIDVLCSDKTGTLTAGTMSFDATLDPFGAPADRALFLAFVNSTHESGIASPLDAAILAMHVDGAGGYSKTDELPFDFERRRLSVVVEHDRAHLIVTKGAPESVLAACTAYERGGTTHPLDADASAAIERVFRELSARGLRVLAVASRTVERPAGYTVADERDLVLAGFVTFADHLLEGIADTVARLRADGVHIKILSGDNELVTQHICRQVGIDGDRVVLGTEVERMTDPALSQIVEHIDIFARVSPAQKHRIVRAMRANDHVIGYLGDGINDAPSLHGADVGISVAGAVDVAREAADLILIERRLDVLHAGILAGRRSSGNVLKYLLMGTSSNFGNMFSMAGATLVLPFLPMLPLQILLNNFLYDLAQLTIPTDQVDPAYIRKPERWDIHLIRRFMLVIGPISSVYDFLTFYVQLELLHFGEVRFHTGWFVESLATQTLVLFVIRTAGRPWRDRPSKPLAITTLVVVSLSLVLPFLPFAHLLGFAPLPAWYFVFLFGAVVTYLAIVEVVKSRLLASQSHRAVNT